jgi:hypothetical protein
VSADGVEQRRRATFDEIEYALEILGRTLIRVGDLANPQLRRKIQEQGEASVVGTWPQRLQGDQVVSIHCQDPVKTAEIIHLDLTRDASAEGVATAARGGHGARIGWLSDLVVMRCSGVDCNPRLESCARDQSAEYAFRRRRATDIAGANKE